MVQRVIYLTRDQHIENNALHAHWCPAVSPNMPILLWLKLPWTDLSRSYVPGIDSVSPVSFNATLKRTKIIIHTNGKHVRNMRMLPLPDCCLCFYVIKNLLQLKRSPNLPFFSTKQFAEIAELLKASARILAR